MSLSFFMLLFLSASSVCYCITIDCGFVFILCKGIHPKARNLGERGLSIEKNMTFQSPWTEDKVEEGTKAIYQLYEKLPKCTKYFPIRTENNIDILKVVDRLTISRCSLEMRQQLCIIYNTLGDLDYHDFTLPVVTSYLQLKRTTEHKIKKNNQWSYVKRDSNKLYL